MVTMTSYPFPLPEAVMRSLQTPAGDGKHYLDVRVAGKWDGILVVDGHGMCIGVYIRRRIEAWSLPFAPNDIEAVRSASVCNRVVAAMPFDLWSSALLTIVVLSPVALLLGWLVWP